MPDNNTIIITMVGFPAAYPVTLFTKDGAQGQSVPPEMLATYAASLAGANNVSNIKIIGNSSMCDPIAEDIITSFNLQYSNKEIEVEVISE